MIARPAPSGLWNVVNLSDTKAPPTWMYCLLISYLHQVCKPSSMQSVTTSLHTYVPSTMYGSFMNCLQFASESET